MVAHKQISLRWKDDGWEIWMDSESGQFDGVCIGAHADLQQAKSEAIDNLVKANRDVIDLTEQQGIER